MDIIKGNFGKCYICDCMDDTYGIKTINNLEYDLAFIDPPFNINFAENINRGKKCRNIRSKSDKIFYSDNMTKDQYRDWCMKWFNIIYDKCNRIVLYCGSDTKNLRMWFKYTKPLDMIIYFLPFNTVITPTSWAGRYRPLLIYAKDKNMFLGRNGTYKFDTSVMVQKERENKDQWKHPCPIDSYLVYEIFRQLKPKSVLDPFLGSGTTAEICESLGIKWLGYEIDENGVYSNIIKKRIEIGIKKHKSKLNQSAQMNILDYVKFKK